MTQWRVARPMPGTPKKGIVSFTFDDFPKSAGTTGAQILEQLGARATYYTCTGMMGRTNVMGELCDDQMLEDLMARGHEIAAHTQSHLDCSRVNTAVIRYEIKTNRTNLAKSLNTPASPHFAWPYGETQCHAKTRIDDLTRTARGILPGINTKGTDMMQLRSLELTPNRSTTQRALKAIEHVANSGGWAIIFTHDVRDEPSAFGTRPEDLKQIATLAASLPVDVLTVGEAYQSIMGRADAS